MLNLLFFPLYHFYNIIIHTHENEETNENRKNISIKVQMNKIVGTQLEIEIVFHGTTIIECN